MEAESIDASLPAALVEVLESASRLQQLVPGAVLVGGSAAAMYAAHLESYDHDHVLQDLRGRFDIVLEALEQDPGFHTASLREDKIILGNLGGIETGIRQLIRQRPLEVQRMVLPSGNSAIVPTRDETLRVKGFLIVRRNMVRDFLDVAALSERLSIPHAAAVLSDIDEFYTDDREQLDHRPVLTQLIRQLSNPEPRDSKVTRRLQDYKGLNHRWGSWETVREQCGDLALAVLEHQR